MQINLNNLFHPNSISLILAEDSPKYDKARNKLDFWVTKALLTYAEPTILTTGLNHIEFSKIYIENTFQSPRISDNELKTMMGVLRSESEKGKSFLIRLVNKDNIERLKPLVDYYYEF